MQSNPAAFKCYAKPERHKRVLAALASVDLAPPVTYSDALELVKYIIELTPAHSDTARNRKAIRDLCATLEIHFSTADCFSETESRDLRDFVETAAYLTYQMENLLDDQRKAQTDA